MFNPNIEENRISLANSICEEIEELYPILVQACCEKYPGLDLSQTTLEVHTKVAFNETKSALRSDKEASRLAAWITFGRLWLSSPLKGSKN